MARADWRSASAYEELLPLDAPAFAYEFLRRNPEFLTAHARLARKVRRQKLDPAAADAFAAHWGVRFRPKIGFRPARRRAMDAPRTTERGDPDEDPSEPRRS